MDIRKKYDNFQWTSGRNMITFNGHKEEKQLKTGGKGENAASSIFFFPRNTQSQSISSFEALLCCLQFCHVAKNKSMMNSVYTNMGSLLFTVEELY